MLPETRNIIYCVRNLLFLHFVVTSLSLSFFFFFSSSCSVRDLTFFTTASQFCLITSSKIYLFFKPFPSFLGGGGGGGGVEGGRGFCSRLNTYFYDNSLGNCVLLPAVNFLIF